jgi:hypothetical protein
MRSICPRHLFGPLALAGLLACGCATTPQTDAPPETSRLEPPPPPREQDPLQRSYVFGPGSAATDGEASFEHWLAHRNDAALNPRPAYRMQGYGFVEVYQYDRRTTSNGRVREHSRTVTRSGTYRPVP